MKFSIQFSEILNQLKEMTRVAATNKTDAVTQNILLSVKDKQLTMKATDDSIELEATVPLIDVESEGTTTVNAAKFFEVCNHNHSDTSPATIELDETKEILIIKQDSLNYEIRSASNLAFPQFEEMSDDCQIVSLKQKQLKTIIDMSVFCVTNEDFRDYLRGVRFEADADKLSVFSSDGHRMAALETTMAQPVTEQLGVLMTKNGIVQIGNIIDANSDSPVELKFSKNYVSVLCNGYSLKSKLIVTAYPNVRGVIPRNIASEIRLQRQKLASSIAKVSVMSSKRVNGVTMTFNNDELSLFTENSEHEIASCKERVNYQGQPVEIALNASYVIEILNHLKNDEITISFPNPLTGALIAPVNAQEASPEDVQAQYIISKIVI